MKKTRGSKKYILKYLTTIISWSFFALLILFACLLAYYFIAINIHPKDSKKYSPPFTIYTIVSPSMLPKIKVYDVVINKRIDSPNDIKIGDIITFKSTSSISYGLTITHRVQDIQVVNGEYQFITKGDNNTQKDSAPALYSNVVGVAYFKIPQLGRIQFFVASKFGWLLVVILPAMFIIARDISKIMKLRKIQNDAKKYNKSVIDSVEKEDNKKLLAKKEIVDKKPIVKKEDKKIVIDTNKKDDILIKENKILKEEKPNFIKDEKIQSKKVDEKPISTIKPSGVSSKPKIKIKEDNLVEKKPEVVENIISERELFNSNKIDIENDKQIKEDTELANEEEKLKNSLDNLLDNIEKEKSSIDNEDNI